MKLWITVMVLALFFYGALALGDFAIGRVVRVLDGDTFEVAYLSNGEGLPTHIRLYLASAPELTECYGPEADIYACRVLFGRIVWLEHAGRLTYERLLAFVYLDPEKLTLFQALMVAQGFAKVDVRHKEELCFKEQMERLQTEAQTLGLGLWEACGQ